MANTSMPRRQTVHHLFHSLGEAFWAGTSFCSATSRLARSCECTPTFDWISAWLTGWPF